MGLKALIFEAVHLQVDAGPGRQTEMHVIH